MIKLDLKPMSVNEAYTGRRFKTAEYKKYVKSATWMLPKSTLPEPPYEIMFEFGLSNILSDWDNPIKPTQDIIAERYGFNDKLIMKGTAEKVVVPVGKEYIKFDIIHYEGRR